MSEPESVETVDEKPPPTVETVEAMVRAQMAKALGGRRGIIEAAIPGLLFTILWLTTKDIRLALIVSGAGVAIALVARLLQRSTVQYVFNAAFSIAIGYVFTRIAANAGGDASDQALAFFLPGILYSLGYTLVFGTSSPVRLAARRIHARQRDGRPAGLARGQAGGEALHPADLGAAGSRRDRGAPPGPDLAARLVRARSTPTRPC